MTPGRATQVLFVNSRPDALENPGGDTVQVNETKAALAALGVTVHVRSPRELSDLPPFDVAHVFNLQMPEMAARVFDELRGYGRPIVFSPIYWDTLACWFETAGLTRARWRWPARVLGKERCRRLFVRWQHWKAPGTATWKVQRRLLQEAARVLPNSQAEVELLHDTFKLNSHFRDKCDVVPNGVRESLYGAARRPPRERREFRDCVLQVGTISPVKNQLSVIEALIDVPVPLVFIGHTPQETRDYAACCRRRGDERGQVHFVDHLASDELPDVYAAAAVHVLPSWRETPGLVSLEAAAAGCRVVSTSIGSASEYFGELAWYCHPADRQSIRDAVTSALAAPKSPGLRQRVLANYTWRHAGEATLAAYRRVADAC